MADILCSNFVVTVRAVTLLVAMDSAGTALLVAMDSAGTALLVAMDSAGTALLYYEATEKTFAL